MGITIYILFMGSGIIGAWIDPRFVVTRKEELEEKYPDYEYAILECNLYPDIWPDPSLTGAIQDIQNNNVGLCKIIDRYLMPLTWAQNRSKIGETK